MRVFIFEPCNWEYCGGALGVIANDFDEAVKLLRKEGKERSNNHMGNFSESREDYPDENSGQWLLTNTFDISDSEKPRVFLFNFNYA